MSGAWSDVPRSFMPLFIPSFILPVKVYYFHSLARRDADLLTHIVAERSFPWPELPVQV